MKKKQSAKAGTKQVVSGEFRKACRRVIEESLKPDVIFDRINNDDRGELQEMCTLIDPRYPDLLEKDFRSRFRNRRVNAKLDAIEARLKSHIFEALAERLG